MKLNREAILGFATGIITASVLITIWNDFVGTTPSEWVELLFTKHDWSAWLMILAMGGVPIITGVKLGLDLEDTWKVIVFPIIAGICATIVAFCVGAIITLWISGDIFFVIVAILLLVAICAPATKVILIIFDD